MFGCARQRCEQQARIFRQEASMQRAEQLVTQGPHRSSSLPHTYVRAHVCECGPICVLMSAKARGHVWVSLLRRCSPNPCPLLRQSFLPSLELTDLLRLAGASKPQGPTCLCPQHWDHECLPHAWVSYMDARDGTPMLVHTKQVLC